MIILGVDPGLTRCGFGVVETRGARLVSMIDVGVSHTSPDDPIPARLGAVADALDAQLDRHKPGAIALERVFSQHNVSTVMGTAQVSGVVMLAAHRHGIPIATYTPSEVKAAVTGSGRAAKAQVGAMVATILGLGEPPKPADAADALAIAICHAWRGASLPGGGAATSAQVRWAQARDKAAIKGARGLDPGGRPRPASRRP